MACVPRIFVNEELTNCMYAGGLPEDAEAVGGRPVVVSFHSLEDRIVKTFTEVVRGGGSRHPSEVDQALPSFEIQTKRPIVYGLPGVDANCARAPPSCGRPGTLALAQSETVLSDRPQLTDVDEGRLICALSKSLRHLRTGICRSLCLPHQDGIHGAH